MHLLLCAEDSEPDLRAELAQAFPTSAAARPHPLLLETEFPIAAAEPLPRLAFARQLLPEARAVRADSIRGWAAELFNTLSAVLPEDRPWSLHVAPHYGSRGRHRIGARAWHTLRTRPGASGERQAEAQPERVDAEAGRQRCLLVREAMLALMQRKRRHLLRQLRVQPAAFTKDDSLAQLLLTGPEAGYLSVAVAPRPFEQRHLLSPFPKGEVPMATDKAAPSRAFAKLVEAEARLGCAIQGGETCVDLGASPGSWPYVAANRGTRGLAVDRSPLREDLMANPRVAFAEGDAFRFEPPQPVDWLLCDVLAEPGRSAGLLLHWLKRGWCRHFVVTLKLQDTPGSSALARLKRELPPLTSEFFLTRLCANKKEVCAFGSAAGPAPTP
jgi:23S rRNA (cytidine2498-2'-O)-methyltransferase